MANKRTSLGQVDGGQQDFISIMLSGVQSVAHAAEVGGFPLSTVRKWMRVGHPVRAEYERQKADIDRVLAHWRETLEDPRSTPWLKSEAARQLLEFTEMTKEAGREREDRCKGRRNGRELARNREIWAKEREAHGPPSGRFRAVSAFSVDDPSDEGPPAA
jgi:hypothetical protein